MTGLWFAMNPIGRREDSLLSSLRLISLMKMTTPEADSTSTSRWVNIREEVYWPPSPNLSHCHERPQAFPTLRQAANGRRTEVRRCTLKREPPSCKRKPGGVAQHTRRVGERPAGDRLSRLRIIGRGDAVEHREHPQIDSRRDARQQRRPDAYCKFVT